MLTLLSLPFEILSEVLKHLPARDILRLQRVSERSPYGPLNIANDLSPQVDKFFYRRLFVDIDVWLILNQVLLHECGIQYDIHGLFSNRDEKAVNATRQLVLAPCRLWKHIQRSSHCELRRSLVFPDGYRVRCIALLPGGRWLLVAPSDGSLDLWDVHFSAPYKSVESPVLSLGRRWTVEDISLHPESPNCFVAVVEFSDDNDADPGEFSVIRCEARLSPVPPWARTAP